MVERQEVVKTPSTTTGSKDFVVFRHDIVNDDKEKAHVVEQPPTAIGHRQPSTHGLVNGQDSNGQIMRNSTPTLKRLAIRVLSQDCAVGTWALFHTKKRNKLTTLQLERLVFCNCNLQLLDRLSDSLESTQVNVDKIDIEKVRDIPDIPQEERDLYALLYEEAIAPVHDTRGRRQQRRGRQPPDVGTSAAAGASDSSSSASSEESHEDEVDDETGDDTEDSDA
ncbi:hypothetical protein L7F22_068872 [Adiantum nelumboides]|nr:hypothetical protein [Adiantum nelumboides]